MNLCWAELFEHIAEHYIFPSEIVASFWRKEMLRTDFSSSSGPAFRGPRPRALRTDRFLSWDKFKEKQFTVERKEKPANRLIRSLFAADLLSENSSPERGPILRSLVNPDFLENSVSFLSYIVSILPGLSVVNTVNLQTVQKELVHDMQYLFGRYKTFLNENGLFEPGYERLPVLSMTEHAVLAFPEVLDDFYEYSSIIEQSEFIKVVNHTRFRSREKANLLLFDNQIYEIRWVLNQVEQLLEKGTEPDRIAITAVTEDTADFLFREAALRGIPLLRRQGNNLLDYAPGRLFLLLQECYETDYSLSSLKKLLLHQGYPWQTPQLGRRLIRFGIDNHCISNYSVDRRLHNIWTKNLERLDRRSLLGFFKTLSASISSIVNSPDYKELKRRINGFIARFIDNNTWQGDGLRVLQRCFTVLDNLDDTAAGITGITTPPPFQMFIHALKNELYVPLVRDEGIPVYPYRVAAGICPDHHFIAGVTQAGTEITISRYPFLREDQKKRTGLTDIDLTDHFLSLYECSGKQVSPTCSKESLKGRQLVPGYYTKTEERARESDRFIHEKLLWEGKDPKKNRNLHNALYAVQYEGFSFIRTTGFSERGDDFTTDRIPSPELADRLALNRRNDNGLLTLGQSDIADYQNCGFHYLLAYLLNLQEQEYAPRYFDPLLAGTFTHTVACRLFQKIKKTHGVFRADKIDEYRSFLKEAVAAAAQHWEEEETTFFPPVWEGFIETVHRMADRLLCEEAKTFPEYEINELEKTETLTVKENTVLLKGRIDRLSKNEKGTAVIDYKRSARLSKKDCVGNDTLPVTYQLPFYAYLLEKNGTPVSSCSYYGMRDGAYKHLFGEELKGAWLDRDGLDRLVELMELQLERVLAGMKEGDYRVTENECGGCAFRAVCREKYTLD